MTWIKFNGKSKKLLMDESCICVLVLSKFCDDETKFKQETQRSEFVPIIHGILGLLTRIVFFPLQQSHPRGKLEVCNGQPSARKICSSTTPSKGRFV